MTRLETWQMAGVDPNDVADVVTSASGRTLVADSRRREIIEFDQAGSIVRRFGGPGGVPGKLTAPWRLALDAHDAVYTLDIKQSRVHVFGANGAFDRSLTFGASGITGQDLVVDTDGRVYVGGYRRSTPSDVTKPTVHRLAGDGSVETSFYPLDPRADALNLRVVAGVAIAPGPAGSIYAAQVTGSEAIQFAPDGRSLSVVGGSSTIYRSPVKLPILPSKSAPAKISAFLSQWTQLVTVIPGPDQYVMLVYAVHNPVKYALNIYKDGTLIAEGLGTDCRPIAWGPDGRLILRDLRHGKLTLHTYRWTGRATADH